MEKGCHHWILHLIVTSRGMERYGLLIQSD